MCYSRCALAPSSGTEFELREDEGMLYDENYRNHQENKHAWYEKNGFADWLIVTTEECGFDSR